MVARLGTVSQSAGRRRRLCGSIIKNIPHAYIRQDIHAYQERRVLQMAPAEFQRIDKGYAETVVPAPVMGLQCHRFTKKMACIDSE